jgi:hypothetical protein
MRDGSGRLRHHGWASLETCFKRCRGDLGELGLLVKFHAKRRRTEQQIYVQLIKVNPATAALRYLAQFTFLQRQRRNHDP